MLLPGIGTMVGALACGIAGGVYGCRASSTLVNRIGDQTGYDMEARKCDVCSDIFMHRKYASSNDHISNHPEMERQVRIYADGVYDLFHFGHVQQLKQIKDRFSGAHLMVGVISDEDCFKYKLKKPVMSHQERIQSVKLCPYVDEVITQPPFYPTIEFLNRFKIDLAAHDDFPYPVGSEHIDDCYTPFKDADRFLTTIRTPYISTTELVSRITSRYNEYK
ncbi:unnamed protein product [Caenorhabditis auriculariae]|uniref:choline-phosphate cytidylyltransferase n=1 Tax=Caenorhabditis auriculariae TaxID=2777116 RepID=A0A8S1HQ65_9PELO|nr:unnamed protein product [Caenorhabditis auriculariae]